MRITRTKSRASIAGALAIGTWLAAGATAAHAHGGMVGPEELGPPLTISMVLAFASYWLVLLWPAKKNDDAPLVREVERRAEPRRHRKPQMRLVKKVTSEDRSGTVER
ncbi:MAG TPA: hypothetical protein VMA09_07065 [Candidatus Binataceae bacterium]|nr:hypothetical protein [Candidatus Binataceae bacterium]